ncbi:unnamed protein product, partial [Allacma fusca]
MNWKMSQIAFFYLLLCAYGVVPEDVTTEATQETTAAVTSETTSVVTAATTSATTTTNTTEAPASLKSYGSPCSKIEECDVTIGLGCNKGECDCARPKEMTYDNATNSCIVLESFSCDKVPGMKSDQFNCTKHA